MRKKRSWKIVLRNRGWRRNVELSLAKSGRASERRHFHFLVKLLGEERMIRGSSGDNAESQYSWTQLGNPSVLGLGIEGEWFYATWKADFSLSPLSSVFHGAWTGTSEGYGKNESYRGVDLEESWLDPTKKHKGLFWVRSLESTYVVFLIFLKLSGIWQMKKQRLKRLTLDAQEAKISGFCLAEPKCHTIMCVQIYCEL